MIRYRDTVYDIVRGSLSIVKSSRIQIREYVGKDGADFFNLGKKSTKINCTFIAYSDEERRDIESLLHNPTKNTLYLHRREEKYKDVIPSPDYDTKPVIISSNSQIYYIRCQLIALDPIPYSTSSGEAIY